MPSPYMSILTREKLLEVSGLAKPTPRPGRDATGMLVLGVPGVPARGVRGSSSHDRRGDVIAVRAGRDAAHEGRHVGRRGLDAEGGR